MSDIPQHVAIILDGNGRWAKSKGMPRTYGHTVGAKNVEPICRAAHKLGIKYLTMYAFSTENWNRPDDEVAALLKLLDQYMKNCLTLAKNNNMRVRVIGDKTGFSPSMQEKIKKLEEESKDYTGLNLQIAINYGSRDEMVRAMRRMTGDFILEHGELLHDNLSEHPAELQKPLQEALTNTITEEHFASYLDTADIPDPDLMIRTSGEQRLSNYLMWQLAYAEFYFTPVPWPEFHEAELKEAVEAYMDRDRRYGKV